MRETGRTVPDMNEPLSRYDITVTIACGGSGPDPATFAAAADWAAWRRSASIISAHLVGRIISVVTVTAPDRCAAVAALAGLRRDVAGDEHGLSLTTASSRNGWTTGTDMRQKRTSHPASACV